MKMKIYSITAILLFGLLFIPPVVVSAETGAGITPGSFFYFLDTTFEKMGSFFTFNSEKRIQKALEYAEERLAEAEEVANNDKPGKVSEAMAGYEKEISFATNKSRGLEDEGVAEKLLNTISDNTERHQATLLNVLGQVPEGAKEAIITAIDVSKKANDEVRKQITELKKEINILKEEIQTLKKKLESESSKSASTTTSSVVNVKAQKETEILKKKIEALEKKVETPKIEEKITVEETKDTLDILSSGSNVEMNKEIPKITQIVEPTNVPSITVPVIKNIKISPETTSARVEWETNIPTKSKIFISGGNLSSKVYYSESDMSTRHIINLNELDGGTTYSYEAEAIADNQFARSNGSFSTINKSNIVITDTGRTASGSFNWKISVFDKSGNYIFNAPVHMDAPDDSYPSGDYNNPNVNKLTNGQSYSGTKDWNTSFSYYSNVPGNKTLTFSSGDITKNVTVFIEERFPTIPVLKREPIYLQDENNSSYPVEIPEYSKTQPLATVSVFSLGDTSGVFIVHYIKISSDTIERDKFSIYRGGFGFTSYDLKQETGGEVIYSIKLTNTDIPIGTHSVTIDKIEISDVSTDGINRLVVGLPQTFTFKITE